MFEALAVVEVPWVGRTYTTGQEATSRLNEMRASSLKGSILDHLLDLRKQGCRLFQWTKDFHKEGSTCCAKIII